jgi:polysaccharide deacetylase family protein (PEP-CTERM system associated)
MMEALSRASVVGCEKMNVTPANMTTRCGYPKTALSIDVEDWFHSANLEGAFGLDDWDTCDLRVERNTMRILEILDARNARGTFFVLGWVAEKCPQLVRRIAAAGHEVGSHGYAHQLVYSLQPAEFRSDILRSKHHLEDLIGQPVRGYRAPCFSITDWAIPILQEAGFDYDSSVVAAFTHDRYGRLEGADAGQPVARLRDGFFEVGVSCVGFGKRGIPWGGGGYFRFVPLPFWRLGVRAILRSGAPYVFYIHPWEIDAAQPQVAGLKAINRFRQRVNLEKGEERFAEFLSEYEWAPLCALVDNWSASSLHAPHAMTNS